MISMRKQMIKANVKILIHKNVLDVQGQAVAQSLQNIGYDTVEDIRVGKLIEVVLTDDNEESAKEKLKGMTEDLLANTVIEDYEIEIIKE